VEIGGKPLHPVSTVPDSIFDAQHLAGNGDDRREMPRNAEKCREMKNYEEL